MHMTDPVERIGVRELGQHVSRYIDKVAKGVTFEITKRGLPVARLVPPLSGNDRAAELPVRSVLLAADETDDVLDVIPAQPQSGGTVPSEELTRRRDEERW